MTIKITIQNPSDVDDFLKNEKPLRISGNGKLADSMLISNQLRVMSKNVLGQDISKSNITGIHIHVQDNWAVVSGVNFKDDNTIRTLGGKSFSVTSENGEKGVTNKSFTLKKIKDSGKFPVVLNHGKMIPLEVFFNSIVFEIEEAPQGQREFYYSVTQDVDFLKETGRSLTKSGEPFLDFQLMDFESELPAMPVVAGPELDWFIKKITTPSSKK